MAEVSAVFKPAFERNIRYRFTGADKKFIGMIQFLLLQPLTWCGFIHRSKMPLEGG